MPPPPPLELTLVLAATRDMGIGLHGGLPWTGLKKEMAYFARVTKRIPSSSSSIQDGTPSLKNAVIMGRKTWDSIPPRFRPLKGRLNVVISRSAPSPASPASHSQTTPSAVDAATDNKKADEDEVIMASSLEQALSCLDERRNTNQVGIGKIFVIGGGQIYGAALKLPQTKRILLTRVLSDFECDTFFPLVLGATQGDNDGGEWKRSPKERLDDWVGESVAEGIQEEHGTQYEFQMWER